MERGREQGRRPQGCTIEKTWHSKCPAEHQENLGHDFESAAESSPRRKLIREGQSTERKTRDNTTARKGRGRGTERRKDEDDQVTVKRAQLATNKRRAHETTDKERKRPTPTCRKKAKHGISDGKGEREYLESGPDQATRHGARRQGEGTSASSGKEGKAADKGRQLTGGNGRIRGQAKKKTVKTPHNVTKKNPGNRRRAGTKTQANRKPAGTGQGETASGAERSPRTAKTGPSRCAQAHTTPKKQTTKGGATWCEEVGGDELEHTGGQWTLHRKGAANHYTK